MFRSFFLRVSCSFLPLALFGFGLSLSIVLVLGNPALVKSAVRDSGLYVVLVDDLFLQNQSVFGATLPANDAGVRQAVADAFTPQLLQTSGDNIIDGTYAWLKGETETLQFNVDLSGAKAQAAENVATYVAARAASLPICSAAQTVQMYASGLDVYSLTCRPAELSTEAIHGMVRSSLLTSSNFFEQASVTASTIQDENGQPLYQRLSFIPTVYQWTIKSVYLSGILAAIATVGVVFLSRPKRAGIRRVGVAALIVGIASTVLAILLGFAGSYIAEQITKMSGNTEALQVKIAAITTILLSDVRSWWLRLAIVEIALGVGLLVWWRMTRKPPLAPPLRNRDDYQSP